MTHVCTHMMRVCAAVSDRKGTCQINAIMCFPEMR